MTRRYLSIALLCAIAAAIGGCSRVVIATGTTLGLKATPGDGTSRPPQVTLGYKRGELALVPTKSERAVNDDEDPAKDSDAFSTLASFFFQTSWFGRTEVESFIATGHAARRIQGESSRFNEAFAEATLSGTLAPEIETRQRQLFERWQTLNESQAASVLAATGDRRKPNKTAKQSLQDYLLTAESDEALSKFERAFAALPGA